ncbi:MAG: YihY family inner membrane protein [Lysobacteraceae bacterium]
MQPTTVSHPRTQRLDREQLRVFLRFLLRRFLDDNCFLTAGALSYTTLLALVPLTAAVIGVIAMFPVYQRWGDALTIFLFTNFVPKAAANVADYIRAFAASARSMTGFGAVGVLVSSLLTMSSIEDAFNRIWRVATPRRPIARFLMYWTVLTLGPLLAVLSLAISSYLFSLPVVAAAEQSALIKYGLALLPVVLELIAFTVAYAVIPNRSVALRHALAGGVLATVLFELAKYAIAFYLTRASYQQIYGALAVIPIFLLWIWVCWLVVLLGASLAASLSAFRYQPVAMRLPKGSEFYAMLRLLGRFAQARVDGQGLHTADLHELEPILADDLLQQMLGTLRGIAVLRRAESGEWMLARDLDDVSLGELYEASGLRLPIADVRLPCSDDAIGIRAQAAINALRLSLRERLQGSVGSIYTPPGGHQA